MHILQNTEQFVRKLLHNKLPVNRIFHNIDHTQSVVNAVEILSYKLKITEEERELVLLAAWFHDTGHIMTYEGHEFESQQIAAYFLEKNYYPVDKIHQVIQIIGATQMPQTPSNLLEKIICDADLFHLASSDYCVIQERLRKEIAIVLDKKISLEEWQKTNIQFLNKHHYFTTYGQVVWSKRKEKNLIYCKESLLKKEILIIK